MQATVLDSFDAAATRKAWKKARRSRSPVLVPVLLGAKVGKKKQQQGGGGQQPGPAISMALS